MTDAKETQADAVYMLPVFVGTFNAGSTRALVSSLAKVTKVFSKILSVNEAS